MKGRTKAASLVGGCLLATAFLGGCAAAAVGASGPGAGLLAAELDAIFDDPALAHTHWGVLIRSLDTGETLYERNAGRMFLPASTAKLLTAAAALETLGPEYRYRTTIAAGGPVRDGVLEGPLLVIGTGDPTFSRRFLADPRDAFRAWADSLRADGITRVSGDIVAVDTAFTDPSLGSGWAWDDLAEEYAAEFGALQFNEGVIDVSVFPSRTVLEPGIVVLTPATQYVRIINDTRTMPPGSVTALRFTRDETGTTITVQGEIAADSPGEGEIVAVGRPALFTASVIREALRESGIVVEGPAVHVSDHRSGMIGSAAGFVLFEHLSPPLGEILPTMLKPSQNLIAETLLRTVGRELRGAGTAAAGVEVVDSLVTAWGLESLDFRLADGSGLSRYSLVPPALLVGVLDRMDDSPHRELWLGALPVAGVDGTLQGRMRDPPLRERVVAKTGTLSGVRSLAGYLTTSSGERVAFAAISNHHLTSSAVVDQVVEAALGVVAASR